MQNPNEGNVFGRAVLGLDPETTKLVEKSLTDFHIAGVHKRKNQTQKHKWKEQNPTDFCACGWIHPADRPLKLLAEKWDQYLTFILLFGYCLRFEGKNPSVTQGLCVCTWGFSGHYGLHRYPAKEGVADWALQDVSQYLQKGGIKKNCRQWGNSYRQGNITCSSVLCCCCELEGLCSF